jgi:hypothetical protein
MRKKLSIILLVLILVSSVSLSAAAKPSVFDFDIMNYFKLGEIAAQDFTGYTPGVRMQVNITSWFGLSAEVMCPLPADFAVGPYDATLTTDLVLRLPLGFFEPFLALGPAYTISLDPVAGIVDLDSVVHYNVRTGFDINFNNWLALGFEAKLPFYDLDTLFADLTVVDGPWLMANTYVGLGLKFKL